MLRKVTWKFWAAIGLSLAAYTVLGFFLATNGRFDSDFYAWGLVAATLMPIAFAVVTTIVTKGAWRENDLGLNLVMLQLGVCPFAGILAYVFLFEHGILNDPLQAWIEIGSPWWLAIWLFWRNYIYLRLRRESAQAGNEKKEETR